MVEVTSKTLKWALGVSVAVNLFLIAGGIGAGLVIRHHVHDLRRPPAAGVAGWEGATHALTPEARARIKAVIKQAALSGEPDMDKARALRRQAAEMAGADPYDAAQIVTLSNEARNYEDMARSKIEAALIQNMETLPAAERKMVAKLILRSSFRFKRFIDNDNKPGEHGGRPGRPEHPAAGAR